jgi:hypothetical protein
MRVDGQCHNPERDLVETIQEAQQVPGSVCLDRSGKSHPHWDSVAHHSTDYTVLAHNNSTLPCIIITSTDSVTNVAWILKKDF